MINNRQAGRRRGRGGGGGGNGPRQGGNPGRPDSGNRIDSRARGNASQLHEKYKNLARDAQMQGDRVNTEYYLQFADHYFRVLSESRSRFDEQQPRRQRDDNFVQGLEGSFDAGFDSDDDYGDEGEPIRAGGQGDEGRRDEGRRDGRREAGGRENGREARNGHRRDEMAREVNGRDAGARDEQGRGSRAERGEDRSGGLNGADERSGQAEARSAPVAVDAANDAGDVAAVDLPAVAAEAPAEPRRRGRPRRERAEDAPRRERAEDAPRRERAEDAAPVAIDADRLPPSLGLAPSEPADDAEPKPRRRRVRAPGGEASAS